MRTTLIYVTYYANTELLSKSINSIVSQADKVIIVDNTPNKDEKLEIVRNDNLEIIYLEDNYGIAKAQNIGIKKALDENYDYVMLSDQDTIYPDNYVSEMLKCFSEEKVAAAGPIFVDSHTGKRQFFIVDGKYRFKKIYPDSGKYEVLQLIASGTMIKTTVLKDVGWMREDLFIYWVDMEWCWRAVKKGYKIIGNADVTIEHQLGDSSKDLGFREVILRSPMRHYYITRNAFHLALRDKSLDILHRITLFFKSFRYIIGYPLLSKPHLTHLKYVMLGFWHGIVGKLGKLE